MSAGNRGATPRRTKRTRDDEDVPSSQAHPPSSRTYSNCKDGDLANSHVSPAVLTSYASTGRRR